MLSVLVGLDHECEGAGHLCGCDEADLGLLIEKQHLLEADVADPGRLAEDGAGRGQRYLAVGRARKGSRAVYLVIGQPGQRRSADLGLPNVALGLLRQAHMLSHQRMHRNACAD